MRNTEGKPFNVMGVYGSKRVCLWEEDDFIYIDDIERSWSKKL